MRKYILSSALILLAAGCSNEGEITEAEVSEQNNTEKTAEEENQDTIDGIWFDEEEEIYFLIDLESNEIIVHQQHNKETYEITHYSMEDKQLTLEAKGDFFSSNQVSWNESAQLQLIDERNVYLLAQSSMNRYLSFAEEAAEEKDEINEESEENEENEESEENEISEENEGEVNEGPEENEGTEENERADVSWNIYMNERFHFRVQYPEFWNIGEESENGDGVTLLQEEGNEILVYASHFTDPESGEGNGEEVTIHSGQTGYLYESSEEGTYRFSVVENDIEYNLHVAGDASFLEENRELLDHIASSFDVMEVEQAAEEPEELLSDTNLSVQNGRYYVGSITFGSSEAEVRQEMGEPTEEYIDMGYDGETYVMQYNHGSFHSYADSLHTMVSYIDPNEAHAMIESLARGEICACPGIC